MEEEGGGRLALFFFLWFPAPKMPEPISREEGASFLPQGLAHPLPLALCFSSKPFSKD